MFNISAGTPSQPFQIGTFHLGFYHPLRVGDASIDGGVFSPGNSKTWTKTGDSKSMEDGSVNGIAGTDTFTVGNSLVVKTSEPFEVINTNWGFPGYGVFTLARSNDNSTAFSQVLLDQQKDKIIVLTYDQWKDPSAFANLTGSLTIGAKPTKKCAAKWTMFGETVYEDRPYEQWTVNISKLIFGKYSLAEPGQVSFQINDPALGLPSATYDTVLKSLGSTDGTTIPCDVKTKITFILDQQFTVDLSPTDFVNSQPDGTCILRATKLVKGNRGFILPIYVLRNYCLLLDYQNLKIGLASRTINSE